MAIICRPVAGLRASPSPGSELLTQEVFGRTVQVLSEGESYWKCRLADGYEGFLPAGAIAGRPADGMEPGNPTHIVIRRFTRVISEPGGDLLLPMGSHLVAGKTGGSSLEILLPGGRSGRVASEAVAPLGSLPWELGPPDGFPGGGRFMDVAGEVLGTPYLWGGRSTFGFDCSGLVQFVLEFFGHRLPRDSREQARLGKRVEGLEGLRPLDLVFFGGGDTIDHVGIHLGGLSMLHSSGHVRVESLSEGSGVFRRDLLERYRFSRRLIDV